MRKRTFRVETQGRGGDHEIPPLPNLAHLVSLEEIDHWLARYRDLVKTVEGTALEQLSAITARLEAHRMQRRAELS